MKKLLIALWALIMCSTILAQKKYDANWVFGIGCGIDFNDSLHPRAFHANCFNYNITNTLSDSTGKLLMHFTGIGSFTMLYSSRFQVNDLNNSINLTDTLYPNWEISRASFLYSYSNKHTLVYQGYRKPVFNQTFDTTFQSLMIATFDSNLVLQQ